MKDTEHLSVRPIFHWTDEKINVHLFSCVLAYRLCCLAVKELADKGIRITINDLLVGMSEIRRVTTFFGDLGPNRYGRFLAAMKLRKKSAPSMA